MYFQVSNNQQGKGLLVHSVLNRKLKYISFLAKGIATKYFSKTETTPACILLLRISQQPLSLNLSSKQHNIQTYSDGVLQRQHSESHQKAHVSTLMINLPRQDSSREGAYLQKNYDWRTAVSRCLCSHLQATVKLWVKRGMAHPLSQRIKRADDYSRLQCPKTGFQIDKARIQCSPHYGSITIEGNTIAFTELQSWSLCISSVELSNSSHFRHKPFLGKQSQKVLKSF